MLDRYDHAMYGNGFTPWARFANMGIPNWVSRAVVLYAGRED